MSLAHSSRKSEALFNWKKILTKILSTMLMRVQFERGVSKIIDSHRSLIVLLYVFDRNKVRTCLRFFCHNFHRFLSIE